MSDTPKINKTSDGMSSATPPTVELVTPGSPASSNGSHEAASSLVEHGSIKSVQTHESIGLITPGPFETAHISDAAHVACCDYCSAQESEASSRTNHEATPSHMASEAPGNSTSPHVQSKPHDHPAAQHKAAEGGDAADAHDGVHARSYKDGSAYAPSVTADQKSDYQGPVEHLKVPEQEDPAVRDTPQVSAVSRGPTPTVFADGEARSTVVEAGSATSTTGSVSTEKSNFYFNAADVVYKDIEEEEEVPSTCKICIIA